MNYPSAKASELLASSVILAFTYGILLRHSSMLKPRSFTAFLHTPNSIINMARALTKQHLRDQSVNETLEWLVENYPILELGKRSPRGGRKKLLKGHYYKIKYVNSVGKESERVIEVLKTDRKYVEAYCYLSR